MRQYANRPGAGACERYYCTGSDGASDGGGAGSVEASTQGAVKAAQALAAKNQGGSGRDLLGDEDGDTDKLRFGSRKGFGRMDDGPLKVVQLKLEAWCGRKAPTSGGTDVKAKAREDAAKLADWVSQAQQRMDSADIPFKQRQRVLQLIDCAENLRADLLAFGSPKPKLKPTPKAKATAQAESDDEGLGSTPQLLRENEDLGRPYVDCASYKRVAKQLRSGLHVQKDAIAKTQAMLDQARAGAAESDAKGKEQAKAFAVDTVKTVAGEYLSSIHALDKGLSKTLQKAGISRAQRKKIFELKELAQKAQERVEFMPEASEHTQSFIKAGGVRAYMKSTSDGLQASWNAACQDPELREELLGYAGESIAAFGGPAVAFGFKATKADIDLAASAISGGLDKKEAAQHAEALRVMRDQLSKNEESIRFLEEEGAAQCE